MDGTLIDSTPAIVRAWTTWAIEYGVTAAQLAGQHGRPTAAVARELVPSGAWAAALSRIHELELADVGDIVVLPGAANALAGLKGAACAIATSCTKQLAAARIKAADLAPPRIVVTVDDVARGKPAPDPYLEAARRLGVDPSRCLVVEDAPAGLISARAAGCLTLAVATTTPIDDLDADIVCPAWPTSGSAWLTAARSGSATSRTRHPPDGAPPSLICSTAKAGRSDTWRPPCRFVGVRFSQRINGTWGTVQ